MKQYWFKAKKYGMGWQPASWQAWVVLVVWIGFNFWNFSRLDNNSHFDTNTLTNFVPQMILSIAALIVICYKTGEPLTWRWGGKDIKQNENLSRILFLIVAALILLLLFLKK